MCVWGGGGGGGGGGPLGFREPLWAQVNEVMKIM